jgi:hypothetical protein
MKKRLALSLAVLCLTVLPLLAPREASAANCECYLSSDCRTNEYCNWNDGCTRHCELQGAWQAGWGSPPVSRADCDQYTGACHDNLPQPPNGNDGDGENCEPPNATAPNGTTINFKVRDGNCATKPVVAREGPNPLPGVETTTEHLVELAEQGGGLVLLQADPYLNTMMYNMATLALGQYDFLLRGGSTPAVMADVRGTCAAEALRVLGEGLTAEIQVARRSRVAARPGEERMRRPDGESGQSHASGPAHEILHTLSPQCQEWLQTRPHNCQFPHPEGHHHPFEHEDGLDCIAHELQAMARSLNLRP